jgi:ABC-2 type transport system permease protein
MTWRVVARRDCSTTAGTRSVKLLLGTLAAVVLLAGYIYPVVATEPITTARFPDFLHGALTTLVPFVAMLLTYGAIAGERESGAILLSLSLPHSRSTVVLGKLLRRAGLVTAALVGSLLAAGALVVYPFGEATLWRFAGFLGLSVLFAAVWSALGIAVSVTAATRRRALVLGFGLVFLFVIVWDAVVAALGVGLDAIGLAGDGAAGPVKFLVGFEPGRAFGRAITGFIVPGASVEGPWYLNEWTALGLLICWAVVPLGIAYRRFDGGDLS